jgi:hypothetical protein
MGYRKTGQRGKLVNAEKWSTQKVNILLNLFVVYVRISPIYYEFKTIPFQGFFA